MSECVTCEGPSEHEVPLDQEDQQSGPQEQQQLARVGDQRVVVPREDLTHALRDHIISDEMREERKGVGGGEGYE